MEFVDVELDVKIGELIVERVGDAFQNSKLVGKNTDEATSEDTEEKFFEIDVDVNFLKSLDPKEWKQQDHYAVLGLEEHRFDATEEDLRRAFRKMVLLHHPDKRKAKGEEVDTENDYFTCITKAYEVLGNPKSRRAYDSVDPEFNNELPTTYEIENDFYPTFNKYFELNARWSEKKNVPQFGDENSGREEVERFYSFWYDFKSWREFSYLDEEDKEKGQDRDERRWIEKENKAARIKRKKEEMQRIRMLVDSAYNNDKRIQKFKNEEKERKLAAKRAKMDAIQAQKAEKERAMREAQLAKERAEKAEQKRIEQIRLEKEQQKKVHRKEKKQLRDRAKECKYYGKDDKDMLKNMEGVEKICETFTMSELQELNKHMGDKSMAKAKFLDAIKMAESKIQAELELANQNRNRAKCQKGDVKMVDKNEIWSNENVQLLIKAVNLFPAGTTQRWDVIAAFINQHSTTNNTAYNITARDVLNKAKALQSGDFSKSSLKTQANQQAFESFEKSKRDVPTCSDITVNNYEHASSNGELATSQPIAANASSTTSSSSASSYSTSSNAHSGSNHNNNNYNNNTDHAHGNGVANTHNNNGGGSSSGGGGSSNNTASGSVPSQAHTGSKETHRSTGSGGGGGGAVRPWTTEEQALLEQAIKTYDNSTPDRWERIAACIPNRSKKDCLRRVKELVDIVNAKKEAQQAIK